MRKNLTELVFILDKSGSMAGLERDTIGGFNAMLEKMQSSEGDATVTTVLFDNQYELLHDRIPIKAVAPLTEREYVVGGTTALLDAVGRTIHKMINAVKRTALDYRPDKVMFVITTDGHENASQEYTYRHIQALIEQQKKEYGWEFIFLGANIDAIAAARNFGIGADRAANYHADSEGTRLNFEALSEAIIELQESRPLTSAWKERIDRDFKSRTKFQGNRNIEP